MKRFIQSFFLICFAFGFAQCSGNSLVDQYLNTSGSDAGVLQVMALQHLHDGSGGDIAPDGTKEFLNDLGFEITLHEALIHFHRAKLISEGEDPSCVAGLDMDVSLDGTHDLMGEDLVPALLAMPIIPQRFFCQYELILGHDPEATHAIKFNHPGDPVPGEEFAEAFILEGTWSKGKDSGDFLLVGELPTSLQANFKAKENGEVIDHPLHFHEGEDTLSWLIGIKYDLLLDGVDFMIQSPTEQVGGVYENLGHAVHQHTGDHHM